MNPTIALLLCSGTSSRMQPLGDKFLFEYLGKTILEHQIQMLQEAGIQKIFFVGNKYNLLKIKNICTKKFHKDVITEKNFLFFEQNVLEDGMKGGIMSVENFFPKDNNMLVVSSNDIVEKWFYKDFLEQSSSSQSEVFLCGKKVENYFPGGYLEIKSEKYVKKIVEKPGEGNEPSQMINLVIHLFKNPQRLFKILQKKENTTDDAYELALQEIFDTNILSEVIKYNGEWRCLKYPWHHLEMTSFFLSTIKKQYLSPNAFVSKNSSIQGNVVIEDGVKIFDFAVVVGPAYIGKNSIIGNHCLVRESHIGIDSCIGQGTEVARSYIRDNVFTHQSYIGDSVIDSNVNFGAGSRTGNLRHDGKNISVIVKNQALDSGKQKLGIFCGKDVRFGINSSFFPGICIGKNSHFFPNVLVTQNIEKNSFVRQKKESIELEVRKNKR